MGYCICMCMWLALLVTCTRVTSGQYCRFGDYVCMAVQEKFVEHGVVPDVIDVPPTEKATVRERCWAVERGVRVHVHLL